MADRPHRLVIVVRPAAAARRLPEVLGWLRALVPSALLLVSPVNVTAQAGEEVVQLECSDGLDGPLAVATLLARHLAR
jgi:hypothetical protein